MLAEHLPRESSLVRELAGEPAEWCTSDYLLAHVADGISALHYAYIASHSKTKPRAPLPIPRPKARSVSNEAKPQMSTPNEVAAFFGAGSVNVKGR